MTAEQYQKFQESPFMQQARLQDQRAWTMTADRDKQRRSLDPSFHPKDTDFTAAKAFDYDKLVNYYKVLGVDEYAPQDEIKKAYKKLSLVYHPDKTTGMSKEQQEEHAAIFIELKNAYLTLSDQATRRQYDRDRDHMDAGAEVNGFKRKPDKASFDAAKMMAKLAEMQKPPGGVQEQEVPVKLEKFFYGGSKSVTRSRKICKKDKTWYEDAVFRVDVPKGAEEKWECLFKKGGDQHHETQPDALKLRMVSKPHKEVERRGADLFVKQQVILKPDAIVQPFLSTEISSIGGRHILLWGRNPLYSQVGSGNAGLQVGIQGEGIGSTGRLVFTAKLGAGITNAGSAKPVVISVRTTKTQVEFFVGVSMDTNILGLKRAISELLQWPENQPVKLSKQTGANRSLIFNDTAMLGTYRSVILDPPYTFMEVPMGIPRAREILDSVLCMINTEDFREGLDKISTLRSKREEYKNALEKHWRPVFLFLPTYGYNQTARGLWSAVQRALWVLRQQPDAWLLQARFAEFGFEATEPPKPRIPKRRKLQRPEVESFLWRNGLGPQKWQKEDDMPDPGSETDPDEEQAAAQEAAQDKDDDDILLLGRENNQSTSQMRRHAHGLFGAAVHPQMVKRARRRDAYAPMCELELAPVFGSSAPMQLFTKPTTYLHFYSNLKQAFTNRTGFLKPRPMFAIAVCCPSGAKRLGRQDWNKLRAQLVPLLKQTAFHMLREARGILPRPLLAEPVFPKEMYRTVEGTRVLQAGEDEGTCEKVGDQAEDAERLEWLAESEARSSLSPTRPSRESDNKTQSSPSVRLVVKHLGSRKPRVLCLHSAATGEDIFRTQVSSLLRVCKGKIDFVMLEGPEKCTSTEAVEDMSEWFVNKPMMQYTAQQFDEKNWRIYKNLEATLDWFQGQMKKYGPIDAILGYADGANFATLLAAQSFIGTGMPLSCVCLLCPHAPGYQDQLPELFHMPVQVKAFIVRGEQEGFDEGCKKQLRGKIIEKKGEKRPSDHVVKLFQDPEVHTHPEGHRPFPSNRTQGDQLCQEILWFLQKSCGNPAVVLTQKAVPVQQGSSSTCADERGFGGAITAEAAQGQLRELRLKSQALREVWEREARQEAKKTEYFKAAEARAVAEFEAAKTQASPAKSPSEIAKELVEQARVWKDVATRAFKRGDFFSAQLFYSRELECIPEDDVEKLAVAYSNRSACLAKVQDFHGALEDGRKVVDLRPTWGRAWSRCGTALTNLGDAASIEEAREAWFKALEFDPGSETINGLTDAYRGVREQANIAHENKEKGNEACRVQEWTKALAYYTISVVAVPAPRPPRGGVEVEDEHSLLRSIAYANRSAALCRLKLWNLAVLDAQRAVGAKKEYSKAWSRLGLAQLGCTMNEQAYQSFAKALELDEKNQSARKGREVCLGLIPRWESPVSVWRRSRFYQDAHRPLGSTRVYAMSDIHYDHAGNEEWAHGIDATKFLDDVLIIAGNVCDTRRGVIRALTTLRAKFRRVFYLPGNHEMWLTKGESTKYPDSLSKLWALFEACDELDVDVFPAAVCKDVYVVPLLSWYNAAFDTKDPFPDPKSEHDKYAKWPIDPEQQVWRYMLALNREHLNRPYHNATVITASHFAPRTSCPVYREKGLLKVSGCLELDEQIREIGSSLHIYGHTNLKNTKKDDGVAYVHRGLGLSSDHGAREPILCVYNGKTVCMDMTMV